MNIKKEIDQAAVAAIKCPSCGAEPTRRCRNSVANDRGEHKYVPTHQRRLSTYVGANIHETIEVEGLSVPRLELLK